MSFEKYTKIYSNNSDGITLRPFKKGASFSFTLNPREDTSYRLFTTGETQQHYFWKNEPDGPTQYHTITDSLDTEHAVRDRYCLNLSTNSYRDYVKRAYKKIMWPPMLSYLPMVPVATKWEFGIYATANNLTVADDGFLQFRIDIRLKTEGTSSHSPQTKPIKSIAIPVPQGTYEITKLCTEIEIPENTAFVGVFLEGKNYCGSCYFEQPFLSALSQNLIPPFSENVFEKPAFDWVGQYLSHKEWPRFRVSLNGSTVFEDEIFERVHRNSEWEIELPKKLLKDENTVCYELVSDYHDATPYTINEIGIIEQPCAEISLISVPEIAIKGGKAAILIKLRDNNTSVRLTPLSPAVSGGGDYVFEEKGLHGLLLHCNEASENVPFRIECGNTVINAQIKRIAVKQEDNVITGSGDAVYIEQTDEAMEEYLCWYFSNHIGSFITFRPIYRWSGTRSFNAPMWKWVTRLLNELEIKYVVMSDGRELNGVSCMPSIEELKGKGFLGIQHHEFDGAEFYWGPNNRHSIVSEQLLDMYQYAYSEDPEHTSAKFSPAAFEYEGEEFIHHRANRNRPRDNALCKEIVVKHLSDVRHSGDTRHTGPSVAHKYFFEAGYSWIGGETMYQTLEPYMGFLRGVCKAYRKSTFGVHHAMQWSTTPHECNEHYRRYRLALYVSYMMGATDINTEEGLWRLEESYSYYHRFDKACTEHLKQQQDFYRYVSSHTRSGVFYTPYALIHGREDGASCFSRNLTWGIKEPQSTADNSWDLIKTLYPDCIPAQCVYVHNCPSDRPVGYHSYSPFGNADVLPAESDSEFFKEYKSLAFLGYNHMKKDDAEKLLEAVSNGSTLLLTRAHLTTTTDFDSIKQSKLDFEDNALSFTIGKPIFEKSTVNGAELLVCVNSVPADEILIKTDNGKPLLCRYKVGNGEVLLFNTTSYPADASIRSLYETELARIALQSVIAEKVWAKTDKRSVFAVYNQPDGTKHIYFLAIDWYNPEDELRSATLLLSNAEYTVKMPFGQLIKCVTDGERAFWCESENGEVLSLNQNEATVQGCGTINFCYAFNGEVKTVTVDFSENPVQIISI